MDFYGFYTGKIFDVYEYLGAHLDEKGVTFRVFAPSASKVSVIGEFQHWQEYEMNRVYDGNFWECRVENAGVGMMYKFRIYDKKGKSVDHCDPYGLGMELRPNTASIIRERKAYVFQDKKWMSHRNDGTISLLTYTRFTLVLFGNRRSLRRTGTIMKKWQTF